MPDDQSKDFFISYNRADRDWAVWIAWQLEEDGHSTVIQAWDFNAGSDFVQEMDKAARICRRTVAVLSPHYLNALFTKPEWGHRFAQDPVGDQRALVPVRVIACDPEGLLKTRVYIDLVDHGPDAARDILLNGIKPGRGKPDKEPPFPGQTASPAPPPPRSAPPAFPGGRAGISNMERPQNPHFSGREDVVNGIREAFCAAKKPAHVQAIHGIAGSGKTSIATEYVHRYGGQYGIVWWVRAETEQTRLQDFVGLAGSDGLDLEQKGMEDLRSLAAVVCRALRDRDDWLIVFDNAPDRESVATLTPAGRGHVLITSQDARWKRVDRGWPIGLWESDVARDYLLERTGQDDAEAAAGLAEDLGRLPLALEQAAAYVDEVGCTLAEYRERFARNAAALLERGGRPDGYEHTVATAWLLALEKIEQESPPAAWLVRFLAHVGPDAFPAALLVTATDLLPDPARTAFADDLAFNDCIAVLRRFSLVERADRTLSMHRLVQTVVRQRIGTEERVALLSAGLALFRQAFPDQGQEVEEWERANPLITHAVALADHAQESCRPTSDLAWLLNRIGRYLWGRGRWVEAYHRFQSGLDIARRAPSDVLGVIPDCLNDLAVVYKILFLNFEMSEELYREAVDYIGANYQYEDSRYAKYSINLASDLAHNGKIKESKVVIDSINYVYVDQREKLEYLFMLSIYDGAADSPARGLDGIQRLLKIYGDFLMVRRRINYEIIKINLMHVIGIESALGEWKKCIATMSQILGSDHPQALDCKHQYSIACARSGRRSEAVAVMTQIHSAYRQQFGVDHELTQSASRSLQQIRSMRRR